MSAEGVGEELPGLGVIGAGKVGSTLARLWQRAGYRVAAVYSRSSVHAQVLAEQVEGVAAATPEAVVEAADLTLLTVPDDAVREVAEALRVYKLDGKGIVHTSGAQDAGSLSTLAKRGAMVGSLHPAFPFTDVEIALNNVPGSTFAVEAEAEVLGGWLRGMVKALEGRALVIPPGGKAMYHAALVIACNYAVTLYAVAEGLITGLGVDKATAAGALNSLLAGTVENLRQQGIPGAMVGPLVRADTGTIAAHLDVLGKTDPQLVSLYIQLARLSYPMLMVRGVPVDKIEQILEGGL